MLDFMRFVGGGRTVATNARPLQQMNGRTISYDCLRQSVASRGVSDVEAIEAAEL